MRVGEGEGEGWGGLGRVGEGEGEGKKSRRKANNRLKMLKRKGASETFPLARGKRGFQQHHQTNISRLAKLDASCKYSTLVLSLAHRRKLHKGESDVNCFNSAIKFFSR